MTGSSASDPSTSPADGTPRSHTLRLGLLVGLSVLFVVATTLAVVLAVTRGAPAVGLDSDRDKDQAARESVMNQTRQFVLRINTYGPDDLDADKLMPDYRDSVSEVMTAKFAADFEKNGLSIAEESVAQAGVGRTAEVYAVGVSSIDADSAVALIAGASVTSYPDPKDATKRVKDTPRQFRWRVDLDKVDGTWLVDDYTPVVDADSGSSEAPSGLPSGLPTPAASDPATTPPATAPPSSGGAGR